MTDDVLWRGTAPSEAYPLRAGCYCLLSLRCGRVRMLSFLAQRSPTTIGFLLVCLALVPAFEFSNGFHDAANAVATVIYTNSLSRSTPC
jgi:hypothetical protein